MKTRPVIQDLAKPLSEELLKIVDTLHPGFLVYNAAKSQIGRFETQNIDALTETIATNSLGPVTLINLMLPAMLARNSGAIILMSSLSAFQGSPEVAAYAATKAFNLVLAEGLWYELKDKNVDVLACAPGTTNTSTFLATAPRQSSAIPISSPAEIACATLENIGVRSLVIPGRLNKLAHFLMQRPLPRRWAMEIIYRGTKSLYPD